MSNEPSQHVFRDLMEEQRDRYTVTYQPADARSSIAVLSLFFAESAAKDLPMVSKSMEKEMVAWLERFPVPVKVSAYTTRKRSIRLSPTSPSESHLMGYVRLFDNAIVRRWGTIKEEEIPSDVRDPEHVETAYADIPYRVREEDRALARVEFREKIKGFAVAITLVLLFPASLQAVLHWGQELALPLMLVSAAIGAYKGSRTLGWRKPSRREQRRADVFYRKEHYFYHCEKNPTAFARLEQANHKREVSKENKETKRLVEKLAARRKKRTERNWIFLPRFLRARS